VELEALGHYVAIERIRHGERLTVSVDVPDALLSREVPSFLLQPLVENAIRHGFVDGTRPLRVEVSARSEPGRLTLTVADDGPGPADLAQEGFGLGNTRARLVGLYGPGASLSLDGGTGRGARATVVIPETRA
jgi:two-component system LytT family sensor kinase